MTRQIKARGVPKVAGSSVGLDFVPYRVVVRYVEREWRH